MSVIDRPPSMLTVVEAAKLLRIGRTKAYVLAHEWLDTGGKSGLPCIDFGDVLRVPRVQLELLVGGPLDDVDDDTPASENTAPEDDVEHVASPSAEEPVSADETERVIEPPATPRQPRTRNRTAQRDNQLNLFNLNAND
jgi:hypothetical protein